MWVDKPHTSTIHLNCSSVKFHIAQLQMRKRYRLLPSSANIWYLSINGSPERELRTQQYGAGICAKEDAHFLLRCVFPKRSMSCPTVFSSSRICTLPCSVRLRFLRRRIKLTGKEEIIQEYLKKKVLYSIIARLLEVHRLTVVNFIFIKSKNLAVGSE